MRIMTIAITGLVFSSMAVLAMANPSMLPKHPGYPSGGEYANDTGQPNLTREQSLLDAAASGNANLAQNLEDPNNARLLESQGAGRLPTVQGPSIQIDPPVKEGTRMPHK